MASPSPSLQSALRAFEQQPGVTPDQAAQLRAAIHTEPARLQHFEQAAQAGHLTGFALAAPDDTAHPVGRYDMTTGVVTLPASTVLPHGQAPSSELGATLAVQDMLVRFGHSQHADPRTGTITTVSPAMLDNLQASLNGSPVLARQVKAAASTHPRPVLEQFALLGPDAGAGGTYSDTNRTISLSALDLQTRSPASPRGFDINDLTFVLGHEVQHGLHQPARMAARARFDAQVIAIARDANPINDYTPPVGQGLQAAREDEARAQAAGWNALLSRVQQGNPKAGLAAMYGPLNDPLLNQAHHALIAQDEALLSKIARQVDESPDGRRLAQIGRDVLFGQQQQEEQQRQEQQRQWEQSQAQQHVRSLGFSR